MAKLGILAGSGALPSKLIENCRANGRDIFVLGFEGETDPAILDGVPHGWTRVGAADRSIRLMREQGVGEIVMIGGVRRPSLAEMRLDWRAARLLAKVGLRALGDDGLLKAVKAELETEGFTLLGIDEVLGDMLAVEGAYGSHVPDAQAEADIAHGFRVAKALGALDIGQAAIVQQGLVLGVEAIEGTEALIDRAGTLRREGEGGVLVKASKPGQERRLDLPTIGVATVEQAAAAGLRGIAVEAGSALVVDREAVAEVADRLGLFLVGRCVDEAGANTVRQADDTAPLFFVVAGEPSGDVIGARLMQALRQRTGGAVRFAGIGGERMAEEGLKSLLPIRGLAIMGVLEVLPAARRIFRWVRQTAGEIERLRPAAVVTIDSSGFCFRLAERLRQKPNPPLIVHYVAPMVWAWRPYRAKYAKRAADHLLTLFDFEPPYFAAVDLPATYVGHPVVENPPGDGAAFRARHGLDPDVPIVCVLPGSRRSEVGRLLPVFEATVERLAQRFPGLVAVVPTVETVADRVVEATAGWKVPTLVVRGATEKRDAFAAARAALAASGTVALELALAGVPMVIAYKIWPITAWMIRRATKLPSANLVNIILGRVVVPEFLQDKATPEVLEAAVAAVMQEEAARSAQLDAFREALGRIGLGGDAPSLKAADKLLELVATRSSAS